MWVVSAPWFTSRNYRTFQDYQAKRRREIILDIIKRKREIILNIIKRKRNSIS